MRFAIKSELLRNGLFFRPCRENKPHERASGVEGGRGRRRGEDNLPMEPAACGENGGASLRASSPESGKCRDILGMGNKGAAGRQSRARRKRGDTAFSLLPLFLSGSTSFSLKPFLIDKALSNTLPHSLMRVSLYLHLVSQEQRTVSVPERIPGKPGTRETPCGKRRRIYFSLFIYSEKK